MTHNISCQTLNTKHQTHDEFGFLQIHQQSIENIQSSEDGGM
jgi:hypothetical protein